jgi:hypothetical protein
MNMFSHLVIQKPYLIIEADVEPCSGLFLPALIVPDFCLRRRHPSLFSTSSHFRLLFIFPAAGFITFFAPFHSSRGILVWVTAGQVTWIS